MKQFKKIFFIIIGLILIMEGIFVLILGLKGIDFLQTFSEANKVFGFVIVVLLLICLGTWSMVSQLIK